MGREPIYGKHQGLEGPPRLGERGRRQFLLLQCQPFARDCFKGIRGRGFLGLPFGARVDPVGNGFLRLVTQRSRLLQRDVRIDAQGQKLFAAFKLVFEPPPQGAVRIDQQVQPPAVAQLVGFLRRFGGT